MKKRQVIVVWTDAPTHSLGFGSKSPYYPGGMARDITELTQWWEGSQQEQFMDNNAKRLLLYAPDAPDWNVISQNWNNVLHYASEAGNGLEEFDYEQIINTIKNSL